MSGSGPQDGRKKVGLGGAGAVDVCVKELMEVCNSVNGRCLVSGSASERGWGCWGMGLRCNGWWEDAVLRTGGQRGAKAVDRCVGVGRRAGERRDRGGVQKCEGAAAPACACDCFNSRGMRGMDGGRKGDKEQHGL